MLPMYIIQKTYPLVAINVVNVGQITQTDWIQFQSWHARKHLASHFQVSPSVNSSLLNAVSAVNRRALSLLTRVSCMLPSRNPEMKAMIATAASLTSLLDTGIYM